MLKEFKLGSLRCLLKIDRIVLNNLYCTHKLTCLKLLLTSYSTYYIMVALGVKFSVF